MRKMSAWMSFVLGCSLLPGPLPVAAKDLVKNAAAKKSANRFLIRADGLACYFCAYGLERFFKKAGTVAAFDLRMKEGIVEATLIKGKPLLSVATIDGYIHEAGFSFRSLKAILVGTVAAGDGGAVFKVADTGEELPVRKNGVLETVLKSENLAGRTLKITAAAEKASEAPMALVLEEAEAWREQEG